MHFTVGKPEPGTPDDRTRPGLYAWIVFALTCALMLSDYLSRQMVNAIFPFLKSDWALSDTELASLVSVVSLSVGILTLPLSLLVDRWGRVKSATAMAIVWALATIACGLSGNYSQLLAARAVVGFGEAAYGSAGGAILMAAFPPRLRSTVMGAFISAGVFGSVAGVVLGGVLATHLGWRMTFLVIGAAGLILAVTYPLVVRESKISKTKANRVRLPLRQVFQGVFASSCTRFTLLASGLQMFTQGALIAWLPSFLNRHNGLAPSQAAMLTGIIILIGGAGMVICGNVVDRCSLSNKRNKLRIPAAYALGSCLLLILGFSLPPGPLQLAVIAAGAFFAGGQAGPSVAVITDLTPPAIHATAIATCTLANALLGLAPGPFVTGLLADAFGLQSALQLAPLVSVAVAAAFLAAARHFDADYRRVHPVSSAPACVGA
ncbi:MFS transporter [Azoarcus sp. KH32C]|uniref:MFS transporter n=1 Tax=Azoarcus sp. KH32C TaxID=748247 RepID=UPI0002386947|nr:MFS transporter [Azoarcus sp. KH32C]BAL24282.1 major facilitator superfamily MFS_1 [Azoarcus sp. KH32C]